MLDCFHCCGSCPRLTDTFRKCARGPAIPGAAIFSTALLMSSSPAEILGSSFRRTLNMSSGFTATVHSFSSVMGVGAGGNISSRLGSTVCWMKCSFKAFALSLSSSSFLPLMSNVGIVLVLVLARTQRMNDQKDSRLPLRTSSSRRCAKFCCACRVRRRTIFLCFLYSDHLLSLLLALNSMNSRFFS